jgi:hypothetical protein
VTLLDETEAEAPEIPRVQITGPGVYDMPAEQYHARPELSSSGMRALLPPGCPAKFHWDQLNPPEPKDEFDFGHVAHKLVLGEGEQIEVLDFDSFRTADARAAKIQAYREGKIPILEREFLKAKAMALEVRKHPKARGLFAYGKPEQSLFWRDAATGVDMRARVDWLREPREGRRLKIVDYKGLALDTPIPTPDGWTTMGELKVGDRVFDSSGRVCSVTAKSEIHQRRCYRMRFDDGSSVICDDEHLWLTSSGPLGIRRPPVVGVHTTEQVRATLRQHGQHHHRVQVAGALDLPDAALPIDPYVLGCWLGDGSAASGRVTSGDPEIFDLIRACGYEVGPDTPRSKKAPTGTVYGLRPQLRALGILGHKAVPSLYLRASKAQRLALLQGLMDTDGSWNGQRHQAVFTSTDKALAMAVHELACSLGQRGVLHTANHTGFGLTVVAYKVTFTPIDGLNPFRLPRKADRVHVPSDLFSKRRVIVAVDEIPAVPTQCITVDSPDSTYLCTESMIPTHNTITRVDPESIRRAIADHAYHQQGATYREAAIALGIGGDDTAVILIFQEKTAPFLVHVVQLNEFDLRLGSARNREAIRIYRECTESGDWPGYPEISRIELPAWAQNNDRLDYMP